MKITIELNGIKVEKDIPITWKEVTFKQFLGLVECGDDTGKIISLFTGIDEETLKKAKIYNLSSIISLLGFLKTEMDLTLPEKVLGYSIPKNLEFESIGQFQDLKLEAMTMEKDLKAFEKYPLFVAIYAVNPYDFKKAEELAKEFENAPSEEVMAVGNFTLLKLAESIANIPPKSPPRNTRMRKFRQVLTAWLRNLIFTRRYYTLKRKLRLTEKNF